MWSEDVLTEESWVARRESRAAAGKLVGAGKWVRV